MLNFSELVKSTWKYDLSVFSKESIERVENSIFEKNWEPFLTCIKRQKDIKVKPEEIIRQLMIDKLIETSEEIKKTYMLPDLKTK